MFVSELHSIMPGAMSLYYHLVPGNISSQLATDKGKAFSMLDKLFGMGKCYMSH